MDIPTICATDKALCLDHIEDVHLRSRMAGNVTENVCSFCGLDSPETPIAVNLEHLAEVIYEATRDLYEDANNAPVVDGEMLGEELDTLTVVYNVIGDCCTSR